MTEMKEFLLEHKEKIHNLLNYLWRTIEHFAFRLEESLPDLTLDNSHGNFIELQDGWAEANYPNPTIAFPYGEIGYSLDGLYCALTITSKKISEALLVKLLEFSTEHEEVKVELYGGDDCFTTFLSSKEEVDFTESLKLIKDSKEEIVQIDLSIPALSEGELKENLLNLFTKIYEFLSEKTALAKLPSSNS